MTVNQVSKILDIPVRKVTLMVESGLIQCKGGRPGKGRSREIPRRELFAVYVVYHLGKFGMKPSAIRSLLGQWGGGSIVLRPCEGMELYVNVECVQEIIEGKLQKYDGI